ncbi:MAG: hypothetical protein C0591_01830 [Marinilabiliales bacterium]|nr:MAG: hypothetical protein C0591_01830 [Marinilabiliales bacterium]
MNSIENTDKLTNEVECKNCSNHFQGLFCNQCGQKVIKERITIKHLFAIAFDSFNIHKGLLFTIKLMFTNPGKLINDYLNGRTKDFYNPLKYLLLIASISALFMLWFNIFDANVENTNEIMGLDREATKLQSAITGYMKNFLHIVAILALPFYSLVSKWIFKKHKLHYAEHLTINSYLFAQITFIQIFTIFLVFLIPDLTKFMLAFGSVIFIIYYTYALRGVFNIKLIKSFLSSIAIYVLGLSLMLLFIVTLTIIVMIVLKFSGYNLKELVK